MKNRSPSGRKIDSPSIRQGFDWIIVQPMPFPVCADVEVEIARDDFPFIGASRLRLQIVPIPMCPMLAMCPSRHVPPHQHKDASPGKMLNNPLM